MVRLLTPFLVVGLLSGCVVNEGTRPATAWSATFKTIDVAPNDVIRIVTPFDEPRVVTTTSAEIQRNQHVLYVLPDGSQPITMFVTDADNEAASINMTLVPNVGGLREVDLVDMTREVIRPAVAPSPVQDRKVSKRNVRRDTDDHGENDDYGGDKGSVW